MDRARRIQLESSSHCNPLILLEAMNKLFSYKSEQEHLYIMIENNITSSTKWIKYRKDNNFKKQGYYASPWEAFNKTEKQFFEEIYGKKKTEQEHISFMEKNDITGGRQWIKYHKNNNLKKQGYLSNPWISFNKTEKQFFEGTYVKKKTEKQHIKIIKNDNLTGNKLWYKYWKENNLKEQGYFSCPWESFNKTAKQFFENIYGKKETEKQHIKIIKEHNLRSGKQWYAYWKENNLKEQGYFSDPGRSFNKTKKQFFEEIYGKKKSEHEHIKIIKDNNLTSGKQWFKYRKDNNLKEKGYLYSLWATLNKTEKQFFEELRNN